MSNDMNAKTKLQSLETALRDSGVVDVKFFFSNNGATPSKVGSDVANVLEAMLAGRTINFNGVGDWNQQPA